jgi:hypothetical protein
MLCFQQRWCAMDMFGLKYGRAGEYCNIFLMGRKRDTFLLTYLLFFGLTLYKMYFASIMFPHESIFLSTSIVSERRHVASLPVLCFPTKAEGMWHLCDVFKFCGFMEIDHNLYFTASILMAAVFIIFSHLILVAIVRAFRGPGETVA